MILQIQKQQSSTQNKRIENFEILNDKYNKFSEEQIDRLKNTV